MKPYAANGRRGPPALLGPWLWPQLREDWSLIHSVSSIDRIGRLNSGRLWRRCRRFRLDVRNRIAARQHSLGFWKQPSRRRRGFDCRHGAAGGAMRLWLGRVAHRRAIIRAMAGPGRRSSVRCRWGGGHAEGHHHQSEQRNNLQEIATHRRHISAQVWTGNERCDEPLALPSFFGQANVLSTCSGHSLGLPEKLTCLSGRPARRSAIRRAPSPCWQVNPSTPRP
jgi:hypothetical protein